MQELTNTRPGRPAGRPHARFYRAGKNIQLWLSSSARSLLGNPHKVIPCLTWDNKLAIQVVANDDKGLKVSSSGYLSGNGIIRQFLAGAMPRNTFEVDSLFREEGLAAVVLTPIIERSEDGNETNNFGSE